MQPDIPFYGPTILIIMCITKDPRITVILIPMDHVLQSIIAGGGSRYMRD
jgi:hypothetical protein